MMGAVKFICTTDKKASHYEIHNKVSMAGGAIVREKIRKDTSSEFEGELEIVCEGGTLYRDIKENGWSKTCYLINL